MLVLVQQTNQSILVLAPLIESARAGADAILSDAEKLLPEPLPSPEEAEVISQGPSGFPYRLGAPVGKRAIPSQ